MQYNENARLDASQMGSGGGRGPGIAMGGGMTLIVIILSLLFGLNPLEVLSTVQGQSPTQTSTVNEFEECKTGADIAKNRNCRFVAYTNAVQQYWSGYPGYEVTKTQVFSGSIATGCGTASSQVGPFYCPNDKKVYLDTDFLDALLKRQLGARGGDAAEAYIIAHEYGHHIQNLQGILQKVQASGNSTGPDSPQVRLELQADCYAGVWLANAAKDPNSPIAGISEDDVNRVQDATMRVGDDYIQQQAQGNVQPDLWTHGSSEMRTHWMNVGFQSGDPARCNTFSATALNS